MEQPPDGEGVLSIDLAAAFGAEAEPSAQVLTVYVPDKDRDGVNYGAQKEWVRRFAEVLNQIGGGVTVMPPAEAGWFNADSGKVVWESTVLIYTYVKPDKLTALLQSFRTLLHGFGRETNQGEVVCEFDGLFFRIRQYDKPEGSQ